MPRYAVLTFDDGYKSHATYVAPLLKSYGFGGTFYIPGAGFREPKWCGPTGAVSTDEILSLFDQGFEIGNHNEYHSSTLIRGLRRNKKHRLKQFRDQVLMLERRLLDLGISKPRTYCYPGWHYARPTSRVLKECGYLAARTGCHHTKSLEEFAAGARGEVYELDKDPYDINCTGIFGENYKANDFVVTLEKMRENQAAIFCFHWFSGVDKCSSEFNRVRCSRGMFEDFLAFLAKKDFTVISLRDLLRYRHPHPTRKAPYRSPEAVSHAVKDLIEGKVVCDLGSAEGDNMVFFKRYARRVIGTENSVRARAAIDKGLDVIVCDHFTDEIPRADVYYHWPNRVRRDSPKIVEKLRGKGMIILGGDRQWAKEEDVLREIAQAEGGEIREIPYNEGSDFRESGTFVLCVLRPRSGDSRSPLERVGS